MDDFLVFLQIFTELYKTCWEMFYQSKFTSLLSVFICG